MDVIGSLRKGLHKPLESDVLKIVTPFNFEADKALSDYCWNGIKEIAENIKDTELAERQAMEKGKK